MVWLDLLYFFLSFVFIFLLFSFFLCLRICSILCLYSIVSIFLSLFQRLLTSSYHPPPFLSLRSPVFPLLPLNVILAFLSITSKSFSFPFSRHFSILLSLSLSLVHSFCLLGSSKRLLPIFLFLSSRRLLWPFFLSHFLISRPFFLFSSLFTYSSIYQFLVFHSFTLNPFIPRIPFPFALLIFVFFSPFLLPSLCKFIPTSCLFFSPCGRGRT